MTSQGTLRGLWSSQSTFHFVYTMLWFLSRRANGTLVALLGTLRCFHGDRNFVSTAYLSEYRAIARRFCMLKVRAMDRCSMLSCRDNQCRWRCFVSACRRLYCVYLSFLDFLKDEAWSPSGRITDMTVVWAITTEKISNAVTMVILIFCNVW